MILLPLDRARLAASHFSVPYAKLCAMSLPKGLASGEDILLKAKQDSHPK